MKVLIAGDVHGRLEEFSRLLQGLAAEHDFEAVIQVGDFGFFEKTISAFGAAGGRFPVPVYAIDGNHEDHAWLSRQVEEGAAGRWPELYNLHYQPRGSVLGLGTSRIGFLGGAFHVDRPQEHARERAFPNYIRREDREEALFQFNHSHPHLIVTHSCPTRIGIGVQGSPFFASGVQLYILNAGFDPGRSTDCGEPQLTKLWHGLNFSPRAWVFGHFHHSRSAEIEGTRFVCLGADLADPAGMLAVWDTETATCRPRRHEVSDQVASHSPVRSSPRPLFSRG